MNMALTKEDLEKNRAEIEALESTLHSFATGLGFGEDEAIYLRLLTPKGFDPKNAEHRAAFPKLCYEKAGRWLASSKNLVLRGRKLFWVKANGEEKSVSTDPVAYLRLQNQRGYAPYIVVNPGGANKSSIAEARVIFWEADNPKPKEEQLVQFQQHSAKWGGGMAVETKNSIHSYIRIDKSIPSDQIQETQQRLILLMESDRNIHNPDRLMRLPGFDHLKVVDDEAGNPALEHFPVKLIHPWDGTFASRDAILAELPQLPEEVKQETRAQQETRSDFAKYLKEFPKGDTDQLALNALACIPARVEGTGTYAQYRNILWALKAHFGESKAVRLMEAHSPEGWDIEQVARSGGDHIKIGTLFHIAKQYGFTFPEKVKAVRKARPPKSESSESGGIPKEFVPTLESENGCLWRLKWDKEGEPSLQQVSNFDFDIARVLTRSEGSGGGGLFLNIHHQTSKGLVTSSVLLKLEETTTRDKFMDALKAGTGANLFCTAKIDEISFLMDDRRQEYYASGGRDYRLIDRVGRQTDGFWVFETCQLNPNGEVCTEDESGWLWSPLLGEVEQIPSPKIASPNPNALKNLVKALEDFAPSEAMPYGLLIIGQVVSILHRAEIHRAEGWFPQYNNHGDPGGGKTLFTDMACSVAGMHGTFIQKVSESVAYERAKSLSCLPLFFDDPLKEGDPKALAMFNDFLWKLYNGASRIVRGNCQVPHTGAIVTSNQALGEGNIATESRLLKLFVPRGSAFNKAAYPALKQAMDEASGGLGSLIALGYPRKTVSGLRDRLLPSLESAHPRIADSMAILIHYTQEFCKLAGVSFDAMDFCIKTLCPAANELETQKDSLTDFLEKIQRLKAAGKVGDWNVTTMENRDGQEFLAVWLPDVWDIFAETYQVNYSRQTITRLTEQQHGQSNNVAKFVESKTLWEQYQKSLADAKIAAVTPESLPARPAKMASRKALLIPIVLWLAVDTPQDIAQGNPPSVTVPEAGPEEFHQSEIPDASPSTSPSAPILESSNVTALPESPRDWQPDVSSPVWVECSGEWFPGVVLQAPNHEPNPHKCMTAWKVRLSESGEERYVWNVNDLRPVTQQSA
jgi:hypothetical protein